MKPDLSVADRARSTLHPVSCAICRSTIAHSHAPVEPVLCWTCTSCHPRPYYGNMLGAAQLLVSALKNENFLIAHNLVAAALREKEMWRNYKPEPVADLSGLKISINF